MSHIRFQNGCEVKAYTPLNYFPPKELDRLDKFAQYGLIAAKEAVADAGIEWTDEGKQNTCVITGTSIGGQDSQEVTFQDLYKAGKARAPLFTITRVMPNAAASHITMHFGSTGITYTVFTACASSNHAIGSAF